MKKNSLALIKQSVVADFLTVVNLREVAAFLTLLLRYSAKIQFIDFCSRSRWIKVSPAILTRLRNGSSLAYIADPVQPAGSGEGREQRDHLLIK